MPRAEAHEFRRRLWEIEERIFGGQTLAETEVRARLSVAGFEPSSSRQPENRIDEVAALAAGKLSHADYRDRHGVCGTKRFATASGVAIYRIQAETFPTLVNNLYVVDAKPTPLLVDAGSQVATAAEDVTRGARMLGVAWNANGILERVRDVIVTHAHIDHMGGVARWKGQGARIHVHELDRRVVARFEERIVVASSAVRAFLQRAGMSSQRRDEIEQMYVLSKHMFRSVAVDGVVQDGMQVGPGVAWHTPGHCPGHICWQLENVLFTGDHVLPDVTPHQSPESITAWTGLRHYLESLERVRRLPGVDLALPGHGEALGDMHARVAEIESFHRQRLERVHDLCRMPSTLVDISKSLFPGQHGYGVLLALEEAGAHVEYLAERGVLMVANLDQVAREPNPPFFYQVATGTPAVAQ